MFDIVMDAVIKLSATATMFVGSCVMIYAGLKIISKIKTLI